MKRGAALAQAEPMADFGTTSRSAAVGVAATALDFVTLTALVSWLGVAPRIASLPALCAGIAVQFVGNKHFAFRDGTPGWPRQLLLFLSVEALGVLGNLLIFDRLIAWTPLPYLVCRMLSSSLVYFSVCLPLWARLFAATEAKP